MYRRLPVPGWIALIAAIGVIPIIFSLVFLRDDRLIVQSPGEFQGDTFQALPRTTDTPLASVPETGSGLEPSVQPELTETQPPLQTCTYTRYYWLDHPDNWLTENIIVGGYSFRQDDILMSLALQTNTLPNRLLQEFFAAVLNVTHGADAAQVVDTLNDAGSWLTNHMRQENFTQSETETAFALAVSLEQYNNGLYGPGACADQPATPTPQWSATLTPPPPPPPNTPIPTATRRTFFPGPGPQPTRTPVPQSFATATLPAGSTQIPSITPFASSTPGFGFTPAPPFTSLTPFATWTRTPTPSSTGSPTFTPWFTTSTPLPTSTPDPGSPPEPTITLEPTSTPTWTPLPTSTPTDVPAPTPTSVDLLCNIVTGSIQVNTPQKYMWFHVTNLTANTIRISSIYAVWPNDRNGVLKEILFGGNQIFISDSALSPASIPGGYPWKESALDSYRDLAPGANKKLEFRYETSAASFGYFTQITFTNGCVVTAP